LDQALQGQCHERAGMGGKRGFERALRLVPLVCGGKPDRARIQP
jgi:hypothetical protein